jgi:hypothetical protein
MLARSLEVPGAAALKSQPNGRDLTRSQTAITTALFRARHGPSAALFSVQRN